MTNSKESIEAMQISSSTGITVIDCFLFRDGKALTVGNELAAYKLALFFQNSTMVKVEKQVSVEQNDNYLVQVFD